MSASYVQFWANLRDAIVLFSDRPGQNQLRPEDAELFILQNSKLMAHALAKFCRQSKTVKERRRKELNMELKRGRQHEHQDFEQITYYQKGYSAYHRDLSELLFDQSCANRCDFETNGRFLFEASACTPKEKSKKAVKARCLTEEELWRLAKSQISSDRVTCIARQEQETCWDLDRLDRTERLNCVPLQFDMPQDSCPERKFVRCYSCNQACLQTHAVYIFQCMACGQVSQENRCLSRDLSGQTAFVTGARTKLGHQIALKLLRAGCDNVICTSRQPEAAIETFLEYPDSSEWMSKLKFFRLDLDVENLNKSPDLRTLLSYLENDKAISSIDVLVNCAAQTIRARDKRTKSRPQVHEPTNRYGDARFVDRSNPNSWGLRLASVSQLEAEEVLRVNAVGPMILTQQLLPWLQKSQVTPYIVNVHAREGLVNVGKNDSHLHTNMAKAALHMLTKCLVGARYRTEGGKLFAVHGCDPGWFSVDEYYETDRPWTVPPLDEVDAAARVLYPLWKERPSCWSTRRHFTVFVT